MINVRPEGLGLRLRWELAHRWQGLSRLDLLALALLILWGGLTWRVNQPLEKLWQERQQSLITLQSTVAASNHVESRTTKPTQSLGVVAPFLAFLPDISQRDRQLDMLHALAEPALYVDRVDFKTSSVDHLPVQRLTLHCSVQGSYRDVRLFLNAILIKLPNLALSRLSLEQSDHVPGEMSLQLEADLYYRQRPAEVAR